MKPLRAGLPVIVIVGRPNVGKSTLFNALLGQRRSIVGDEPGITRDRIHGEAMHRRRPFELIDTGGIVPDDQQLIPAQILKQARFALEGAARIIFLIDGRTEITMADRELAQILRRLKKPVILAVNKIDDPKRESLMHEFHELGFDPVLAVSAEHRLGLWELLDAATEGFPEEEAEESGDEAPARDERPAAVRVAIIGRPNVGKSTLLNAMVGADRAIVSPVAGTTRDSVDETVEVDGQTFTFVDTAGIRRRGKTHEMAEKLSVVMARRHIRMSHVALLVVDATEGPVGSDATIGGYAHEDGRALVIVVNKWDLIDDKKRKEYELAVKDQFKFLDYAPIVFLSAKEGFGVKTLYRRLAGVWENYNRRVGTGELNRLAETLKLDRDRRIFFMTQPSVRPPTFVMFLNNMKPLHFSTERSIVNRIRKAFDFKGTPVVLKYRAKRASPAERGRV
ncbi:MAG: ribosome biogenesis GTPase Der [Bryobacteraceae bacterium]|nr:ribosome biogenesis GTPase Der [Bryobacteraceae bacterium]MCO5353628.1 ribosome biogenesis GTPase Der [Bryobacteraceae bacterium]